MHTLTAPEGRQADTLFDTIDQEGRADEAEHHKQDQLKKQKEGKGHWVDELASDSESAVCIFLTTGSLPYRLLWMFLLLLASSVIIDTVNPAPSVLLHLPPSTSSLSLFI